MDFVTLNFASLLNYNSKTNQFFCAFLSTTDMSRASSQQDELANLKSRLNDLLEFFFQACTTNRNLMGDLEKRILLEFQMTKRISLRNVKPQPQMCLPPKEKWQMMKFCKINLKRE